MIQSLLKVDSEVASGCPAMGSDLESFVVLPGGQVVQVTEATCGKAARAHASD
jgi:hypothetical protein